MTVKPETAISPQQEKLTRSGKSAFSLYRELATGRTSFGSFLYYELSQLLCMPLPGLLGLGMRSLCYRPLFARVGRRPAFGRNIIIRNPAEIVLGDKVLIDDHAVLDSRIGSPITLANFVSIGRYTSLVAKGGRIELEAGVNVGSYCRLGTQSSISIGESTLIAAYCYIGPGNHRVGPQGEPLISSEMELKGGVSIGKHAWIGTRSTILDGVTIGDRAIIGAHSLVREDVPPGATVAGVPARILRQGDPEA